MLHPILNDKKCIFFDGDGTLYLGQKLLPSASAILNHLKEAHIPTYICTNNSSKTPQEYVQKLEKLGLPIKKENILISTHPTMAYLKKNKLKRIFLMANTSVSNWIETEGFELTDAKPDAIVLTYDTELNYQKLEKACHLLQQNTNIPYIVTHPDQTCPTETGYLPDIGTVISALHLSTQRLPDLCCGKPNPFFLESTLSALNLELKDAVMIGDRLYTDIQMGQNTKLTTILTLTGETQQKDITKSNIKPTLIIKTLTELL